MNQQVVTVNRSMVGAVALVLLSAAGLLTLAGQELASGACLKVGLVMGAFWLALPSIRRDSDLGQASWMALLTALAAALVIASTRIPLKIVLPLLVVTVVILRVLRPRRPPPARPKRVD